MEDRKSPSRIAQRLRAAAVQRRMWALVAKRRQQVAELLPLITAFLERNPGSTLPQITAGLGRHPDEIQLVMNYMVKNRDIERTYRYRLNTSQSENTSRRRPRK